MEFPIKFDTVKSECALVYITGSHVILSPKNIFLSLKIDFGLANNQDPDKMPHYAAFHLGFHVCQSTRLGDSSTQRINL